jgi:mannosyltransferase OCH1-like enzyme
MRTTLLPLLSTKSHEDMSKLSKRGNNGEASADQHRNVRVSPISKDRQVIIGSNMFTADRLRKMTRVKTLLWFIVWVTIGVTILQRHLLSSLPPPLEEEEDVPVRRGGRKTMEQVEQKQIPVFQPHPSDFQQPELQHTIQVMMTPSIFQHSMYSLSEQLKFLQQYAAQCYPNDPSVLLQQWDLLSSTYKIELWKYCALYTHGGIFVEAEGVLLSPLLQDALQRNVAVISSVYSNTVHGGFLAIKDIRSPLMKQMIDVLVETSFDELQKHPLFLSQQLYHLISADLPTMKPGVQGEWKLWSLTCRFDPLQVAGDGKIANSPLDSVTDGGAPWGEQRLQAKLDRDLEGIIGKGTQVTIPKYHRHLELCPTPNDYCCTMMEVGDPTRPIFLSRHPIFPIRYIPPMTSLPMPYKYHYTATTANNSTDSIKFTTSDEANIPYISTVREVSFTRPDNFPETPNFYEILQGNDCLPSDDRCSTCLRNKKGSSCVKCAEECKCFCAALCKTRPLPKFVSKQITVHHPAYGREMDRIVPRIIHQTWFEKVTKEKYPNMSRLIESWKQSGWEYRFYDDDAIESFLQTHFPPEIFEAYNSLIPGAFKADLFRYCVLLIYGGVYADMDVLLESNLEASIPPDVGFMTPYDAPGEAFNKRHCLWNGLIAVAPAHPFMAKAIENVVNGIRNRFTAVDTDNLLCDGSKRPELSISHAYDTLFTAGPCILGMTINAVLGRNVQETFTAGELVSAIDPNQRKPNSSHLPGRSVILLQNKQDMGAHRFTLLENNLLVAATDMPEYDDRNYGQKQEDDDEKDNGAKSNGGGGGEHYSKTHVKVGVYGLNGLYKAGPIANENSKISISEIPSYAAKLN